MDGLAMFANGVSVAYLGVGFVGRYAHLARSVPD